MTTISSPFKGLAPYDESDLDALLFFGRERDVRVIESNLLAARLTVLYGPSGVGKSSVVRAGVVRRLRSLPEEPVVVVGSGWGGDPATTLAAEVASAASVEPGPLVDVVERAQRTRPVYLVLDQAEEFFVYHPDDDAFERALAEVVLRPLRANVLVVVRDDALARLDAFRGLLPGVFGNLLRLAPLDRSAARAAIVGPLDRFAELTGESVTAEPELVERVLDEVEVGRIERGFGGRGVTDAPVEEGVETPYLQLVMERLWNEERRAGSSELRLATLERLGGARKIVGDHLERAMNELVPSAQAVAAAMFAHLVTPSGTKIAHRPADLAAFASVSESELRGVLEELLALRIVRTEERGAYTIFHDVLASEVLDWRRRFEAEQVLESERAAAARRHRRLAFIAIGAVAAAVAAAGLTVWAMVERGNASEQAKRAQARELDAVAVSLLATDPQLAVLLAAEAARLSPTDTAEDVLRQALQADGLRQSFALGAPVQGVASADDDVIAGTSGGRTATFAQVGPFRWEETASAQGDGTVTGVSATTERLASVLSSTTARDRLLLLTRDARISRPVATRGATTGLVLAPGCGSDVGCAVLGAGRQLIVLDARTGRELRRVTLPARVDETVVAGRSRVAVRSPDRVVRLVDVLRGDVRELAVRRRIESIASDGTLVVAGLDDGAIVVWRASTGVRVAQRAAHTGSVLAVAVARGIVVSGASDSAAQVWNTGDGQVIPLPGGHANIVLTADLTADGRYAVTGSADATAKVWDTSDGRPVAHLVGHGDAVRDVAFAAGGDVVVSGSVDGTLAVWDAQTAPQLTAWAGPAPAPPTLEARASDGALARADGEIVIVSRPGAEPLELRGHRDDVTSVAFSADGQRIVTASRDHDPRVWNARTGESELLLKGHFGTVSDARFSQDGRWIVTAGPITAGLWSARTGELVEYLRGPESRLAAAAFDGTGAIVTSESDGVVRRATCAVCAGIPALLELADARLEATGRALTEAERERYLHED